MRSGHLSLRLLALFLQLFSTSLLAQDPADSTTVVRVGMFITRIINLDTRAQSFEAEFYLWLRWKGKYSAEKYEFVNAKSIERLYEVLEEDDHGFKYLSVKIRGVFLNQMDVSRYPQDRHILSIVIEDYNWVQTRLRYEIDSASTGMAMRQNAGEWRLKFIEPVVTSTLFPSDKEHYSSFQAKVEATRSLAPFIVKILIPIIIVVLMSMLTFFIPAKEIETQVALGATALLTVIALKFVIADGLPDVDYLTNADILLIGSYLIVFLALCESVFTHVLYTKGKEKVSRKIDKTCRIVFPASYAVFLLILFF